jgi:hypothetical protein
VGDVKARELGFDEWRELLEPYGWADITVTAPAVLFRVPPGLLEYEIRMMLKASPDTRLGEWDQRSYLLGQARQAVEAVKGIGYTFGEDAPRIEFGGRYVYLMGQAPSWFAEAELRFTVRLGS